MSSIRLAKTRIFPTDRDPFAMSIKIIAMYRCSKQRRARKRIGGRKETKRLRTIGNWLQCRSHSSMHLQVPSYICAFQERKREKKKKKKKGRVFEQSNRWLFIILSRYIYIYIKLEVFHFFFSSIYFIPFSIHLYRITYAIFIRSRFFLLFFHSYPNPSCAIAAPLRARAITVLAKWICARTKVVYTRKGEREGREEREKEGGWGGGEKLQEFCPLSRFNLISTNWGFCSFIVHVSSPTNYTSRLAKIFTRKFLTYANNQSI